MLKPANRSGASLLAVLMAIIAVTGIAMLVFRFSSEHRRTVRMQERLASGDYSAEGLVRMMSDRLVARAEKKLGMIDRSDIDSLNAEIRNLPLPDGIRLDTAVTRYVIAYVEDGETLPYDVDPIRLVTDQPRSAFRLAPDLGGVTAARTVEVAVVASVMRDNGYRTALTRLSFSKVLPYQRSLQTSGDLEFCVSPGSDVLIQGRVRAYGKLLSRCGGSRTFTGDLMASDTIEVEQAGTHTIKTSDGSALQLASLTSDQAMQDVSGTIQSYGGRVQLASSLGARSISGVFQDSATAGSGECADFSGACGGKGEYNPSAVVQKSTSANDPGYTASCGAAYARKGEPAGCVAVLNEALTYVRYPFPDAPTGQARLDPQDPTRYWNGLFPDYRRESRCTALSNGQPLRTWRCDTNAYGYVLDLSRLVGIEGGLLSIRKTTSGAGLFNPSGFQEVLLIKNASALYSPLTIHTDLPVYIEGGYNTVAPRAAMIDAPMITLLPADADAQLASSAVWDSTSGSRVLKSYGSVRVSAVLRSRYQLSDGGGYYGGTVEAIPAVLGNWKYSDVSVSGSIEGRPWTNTEAGYKTAFRAYGAEEPDVRTVQPQRRIIEFAASLLDMGSQPPGSYSAENVPLASGPRDAIRQRNAVGGYALVRMVQEPTRLPRETVVEQVLNPLSDTDTMRSVVPPRIATHDCSPGSLLAGDPTTCTVTTTVGTYSVQEVKFEWGDNSSDIVTASGQGGASKAHTFALPGTYVVRMTAFDVRANLSAVALDTVVVLPSPPRIVSAFCTPTDVKPSNPDGNGEATRCEIHATRGTYPIKYHRVEWGDLTQTTLNTALTDTAAQKTYANEGVYTVRMLVVDSSGRSAVDSVTVRARHLPPSISSFVCAPNPVTPTQTVSCTLAYEAGTTSVQTVTVVWGDGVVSSVSPSASPMTITHEFSTTYQDTTYQVRATISDEASLITDPATFDVQVRVDKPSANISCDQANITAGETVACTMTGADGTFPVATYHYYWGEDSVAVYSSGAGSITRSHRFDTPGTFTFDGWVEDNKGIESSHVSYTIRVAPYVKPTGVTLTCPATVIEGASLSCDASATAGSYPIERFVFAWGDGAADTVTVAQGVSTATHSHSWSATGSFGAVVTVLDTKGGSGTDTTQITVTARVGPVVSYIGCSPQTVNTNVTTTCTVNGVAGSGAISAYRFDTGSGWTTYASSNTSYSITPSWGTAGTKKVRVMVGAEDGLWSDADSVSVYVNDPNLPQILSLSCPSSGVATEDGIYCTAQVRNAVKVRLFRSGAVRNSGNTLALMSPDGGGTGVTTDGSISASGESVAGSVTYTVVAYESDIGSNYAERSFTIDWTSPPPQPPAVSCSAAPDSATINTSTLLAITYNTRGLAGTIQYTVTDPNGAQQTGSASVNGNTTATFNSITNSAAGTYSVDCSVTTADGSGSSTDSFLRTSSGTVSISITVNQYYHKGDAATFQVDATESSGGPLTLDYVDITKGGTTRVCNSQSGTATVSCSAVVNTSALGVWRITAHAHNPGGSTASPSSDYTVVCAMPGAAPTQDALPTWVRTSDTSEEVNLAWNNSSNECDIKVVGPLGTYNLPAGTTTYSVPVSGEVYANFTVQYMNELNDASPVYSATAWTGPIPAPTVSANNNGFDFDDCKAMWSGNQYAMDLYMSANGGPWNVVISGETSPSGYHQEGVSAPDHFPYTYKAHGYAVSYGVTDYTPWSATASPRYPLDSSSIQCTW